MSYDRCVVQLKVYNVITTEAFLIKYHQLTLADYWLGIDLACSLGGTRVAVTCQKLEQVRLDFSSNN